MQNEQPASASVRSTQATANSDEALSPALTVLQITDCHLSADAGGELLGVNTRASLDAVLECIAADGINPDHVLITGDLAQDASEQAYAYLQHKMQHFACPVSWFPGNHDARATMRNVVGNGPELGKIIRKGGWQLILLDSLVEGKVHGWLDEAELALLENTLRERPDLHTLVSLHHHPIDIDCGWLDNIGLHNRDAFLAVIDRYPHVKAVLWGHIHQQIDTSRNGVAYMATPSTCIQFLPQSDDFAIDDIAPGYRWLHLHQDGRIETEVKRATEFEFTVDMASTGY